MGPRQVKAHCQLDSTASSYLEQAMEQMNFPAPTTSSTPSSSGRWTENSSVEESEQKHTCEKYMRDCIHI
jgi:hypothetical protein